MRHLSNNIKTIKIQEIPQLIDDLLNNIKAKGDLKHFSFIILNDAALQEKLKQFPDKESCLKYILQLGQESGCKFTEDEIKKLTGSWSAESAEELVSILLNLSAGGLEKCLTDIKNDSSLQHHFKQGVGQNFTEFLVQLGQKNGYTFTIKEVDEATHGILYEIIDAPTTPSPAPIIPPSPFLIVRSQMRQIFGYLKNHPVKFLLTAVILILTILFLIQRCFPSYPSATKAIYTDPIQGNDRNDGSQTAPFKTLSRALRQAVPGDTIYLSKGYYNATNDKKFPLTIPTGVTIAVQYNVSSITFKDIKNHWASEFIQALAAKGIIQGFPDGTFKPDTPLTRAEYAALLVKVFNLPDAPTTKSFSDVRADFWAYNVIQQAYNSNFLKGFPDGRFHPEQKAERVQAIAALVNGLGLQVRRDNTLLSFYSDQFNIPDWAKAQVATATAKRLIVNYPDPKRLNPTQATTRADMAAMIYQTLVAKKQMPPIDSVYIIPDYIAQ